MAVHVDPDGCSTAATPEGAETGSTEAPATCWTDLMDHAFMNIISQGKPCGKEEVLDLCGLWDVPD